MWIRVPDDRRLPDGLAGAGFGELAGAIGARLAALAAELRRQHSNVSADPRSPRDPHNPRDPRNPRLTAWFVPGRIEVVGKHTDYAGGRSLICAVERGIAAVSAPRSDGRVNVRDTRRGTVVVLDPDVEAPDVSWATYPATVVARLRRNFPGRICGADVLFESDLPSASGMSSSSAVMIAVLLAVARASRLDADPVWTGNIRNDEDLAAYAATIENGSAFRALEGEAGVGTRGGSEDHTAILCSRPEYLAQYSFRPTRYERSIALGADLVFAVGVSGVHARKTGSARERYNHAAHGIERIVELWNRETAQPEATLADIIASAPEARMQLSAIVRAQAPALVDRLEHFVEESMTLVPLVGDQLERMQLDELGRTVSRSQELAERLLGNQVPETIALARLARDHGAIAASAFGAGFGGSVWALTERAGADRFLERWQNAYAGTHPDAAHRAGFFLTRPGPAAVGIEVGDA